MYSIVSTAIIHGIQSVPISVEADVSDGLPVFEMVGFLASEVQEAKERVRTALKNCGFALPPKHITINFTPANIRKSGSGFDLPVAVAVLTAFGYIRQEMVREYFVAGEVGLNGKVQPVNGILPMVAEAKERGMKKCMVPWKNAGEAALVSDMQVFAVKNLADAVNILNGNGEYFDTPYNIEEMQTGRILDFADVSGQELVKRACETAVSGMHNLLFVGPPGAGKTMIAERIPGILPSLNTKERMELSKIYSVCGLLEHKRGLMQERPFRAPHHTITPQGLAGGGAVPKPGEISLAHKGILFLDELTEFQRETLEILRQPMEEKKICIARLNASYEYPADFMLVAAMNPWNAGIIRTCKDVPVHRLRLTGICGRSAGRFWTGSTFVWKFHRSDFGIFTIPEKVKNPKKSEHVLCARRKYKKCGIGEKIFALTVISRLRGFLNIVNLTKNRKFTWNKCMTN